MSFEAATAYVTVKPDLTGFSGEMTRQAAPMATQFGGRFGKALGPVMAQQSKHLKFLTTGSKYAAAGLSYLAVRGFGDVVKAGSQWEKQMDANVAIADATLRQQKAMEKQAIRLGKATFFSANEAAQAQAELVKGGLSVQQVIGGGLPAALSLAEAGELDLTVAAETTVNAMKLFGIEGEEAGSVADMLSTAANRTTADVLDFAMALKQGGSVTKLAGYDMNESVTVLEALAEAGIKNSDAGTSMKTAVIQLLKPSEKQAKLAKELNIQWQTQGGELKNAAELSRELRTETEGMTKAERAKTFATLAGTDGVRTLNSLYAETPKELEALERANARNGTAQDIARKKMDNVAGSVEQFKGSVETAEIQIYRGMAPALRSLTDEATEAANTVGAVFEDPRLSGGEKVERAIEVLSDELGGMWDRNEMTDHLVDVMDAAIPIVAEHAGELGLEFAEGFTKGFIHADFLGKAVMGAWLLHFVGGRAPFVAAGKSLGKQFGVNFAATAAAEVAATSVVGGVAGSAASGAAAGAAGRSVRVFGPDDLARIPRTPAGEFGERQLLKELGLTAGSGAAGGAAAKWGSRLQTVGKGLGKGVLGVAGGYMLAEVGRKGLEAFGVGDPTEGQGIATGLTHGFNTERVAETEARNLAAAQRLENRRLGIHPRLAPEASQALRRDFKDIMLDLSVDASAGMGEINKDLQRGLENASAHFSTGTKPWRSHTAEAMTGAVHAIETGMQLGTISAAQGQKAINRLLQEIHLVKGNDPFGLAKATVRTFKDANSVTAAGVNAWLNKLDRMPKGSAKKSIEATEGMLRAWAQGHPKIERQIEALTRYQVREFGATNKQLREGVRQDATGPIADAFREAALGIGGALENIGTNTSQMLKLLGLKDIGEFQALVFGPERAPQTRGAKSKSEHNHRQFRQGGGPITGTFLVPGSGSGDTFRAALPPGSFIENRKAVQTLPPPFQNGGLVPVALEPGERGYLPGTVKEIGLGTLEARNAAVKRFQAGGEVRVSGPGVVGRIGYGALKEVTDRLNTYFSQHQAPQPAAAGGLGDAPAALQAAIALAQQMGLTITSTTGGQHAPGSYHYLGRAFDASNGENTPQERAYAIAAAGKWGRHILELFYDPLGWYIKNGQKISGAIGDHSDHVHTAMQLGGLVGRFSAGGTIDGKAFQQRLHRIWTAAAPFFPAGASMPRTWSVSPLGARSKTAHFEDGSIASYLARHAARDLMEEMPKGEATLIHEWTHAFQSEVNKKLKGGRGWEVEGGAEAFAHWAAPQIYRKLGMYYENPPTGYPGRTAKAIKEKGWDWIKHGQFLASGGAVVKTAGAILGRHGLDQISSAGIMGNSWQESGWDTEAMEPGTHNGGLFGFTAGEKSLAALEAFASRRGEPWEDAATQVQFMLTSLPQSMRSAMNRMGTVEDTTAYFMNEWERPNPALANLPRRIEGAKKALPILRGLDPSEVGPGPDASTDIPAEVGFHEKGTVTGAGGGTTAPARGQVKTEKLSDFGVLPDTLAGVERELGKRRGELGRYRAGLRTNKKHPEIVRALEVNINLLRNRIDALREQKRRLVRKKLQEQVVKKIEARGTLPAHEQAIAAAEHHYEEASEYAEQIVGLEPEEGPAAKAYIEGREAPAWMQVLNSEARWRNSLLAGEVGAVGRLRSLESQEEWINVLKVANPKAFNKQKFRLPGIRAAITAVKSLYTPLRADSVKDLEAGRLSVQESGSFHESLVSLQGIGKSKTPMDVLPSEPVPDVFGGLIWDTQMTIRDLGLKLNQAGESGSDSDAELISILREISERERRGRFVSERLSGTTTQFEDIYGALPKFHEGGVMPGPPTQEAPALLRGRERIRTPEQELEMAQGIRAASAPAGRGDLQVRVHGDIHTSRPEEPITVEEIVGSRRFKRAVRTVPGGRPTKGGARR
jgi:TP901 family phage tail tape measure protein